MTAPGQLGYANPFVVVPPKHVPRLGPHAPALPAGRAAVVSAVHTTLTILAVGYLLWANFVVFTGGNAPLTPWHLSDGNSGAGTFMLFIGNWIVLLGFQLLINGPLEYLLTGLLQPRDRVWTPRPAPVVPSQPGPPGWSVPVPTPSTPLSALLGQPTMKQQVFVPPQFGPRPHDREHH